jgi:hypothetical protein
MLTFLRKIRKSFIEPGSARKYLLYALGEIALVVIGILIALQINNWNEWRKDRIKEVVILDDLAKNLEINIRTFDKDIDWLIHNNRSSELILSTLEQRLEFSDYLKQHFHNARKTKQDLFVSKVGYQSLRDQGTDIITNKELADEILNLFEVYIPSILSTHILVNEQYQPFDNHIVQNFDLVRGVGLSPNDYESLFSDYFYINWIKAYAQGREYLIYSDQELIKECKRVLLLIRDELATME